MSLSSQASLPTFFQYFGSGFAESGSRLLLNPNPIWIQAVAESVSNPDPNPDQGFYDKGNILDPKPSYMSSKPHSKDTESPGEASSSTEIFKHEVSLFFHFCGDKFGLPGSGFS
jgi:hypothetical protein